MKIKNMFPQAEHCLKIYELLEPQNSEHQYLYAQLFMKSNQHEKALDALKAAVNLGFRDKERLGKNELFFPLRNKQGFIEIEKRIEQ